MPAGRRYRVELTPAADRQFKKLPHEAQARLKKKLVALKDDPYPPGVERLRTPGALLRIRVGDYRIVYGVHDDLLLVLVIRLGHRREIYRDLP